MSKLSTAVYMYLIKHWNNARIRRDGVYFLNPFLTFYLIGLPIERFLSIKCTIQETIPFFFLLILSYS